MFTFAFVLRHDIVIDESIMNSFGKMAVFEAMLKVYITSRLCITPGVLNSRPQNDSKILNDFRQHCNVTSSNKCLTP